MSIPHRVLAASYLPLRIFNVLIRSLGIKKESELRVLLYHDIPQSEQGRFETQLKRISRDWKFVTPQVFSEMIRGEKKIEGRNILLTFDDGYSSNRRVAEEVLDPLGIKALFFIITDFVDVKGPFNRKKFVSDNIYPDFTPDQVPDTWSPMNWEDLKFLLKSGHSIGSHTRTHARLSRISDPNRLKDEIVNSKKIIETNLGSGINHFAYTFGDLGSFSPEALRVAKENYEFVHTGLRGNNTDSAKWAIRREAFSPSDSDSLVGAILEGGADLLYRKKLRIYESWVKTS
ncbi:polysaccharide deacetylase family protein [Leptospira yasudae]|uniref:Polysaccharide deacetylase n=1 Tax=Leptospira yasudae TaxID=2202201 RepID=A0ABX9M035_9LEPT|nr:polysaccharide deacetylase family protein [Leptospira yasudae]RHX78255.1 polysaccharide deacetylase [Leptospira yasudae]